MSHYLTVWLLEELISDKYRQSATVHEFQPGDYIFRVGDAGDFLCVLLSGTIEICRGSKRISVVEAGSMFGEMGLIDHRPRGADVIAKTNCRVMEIREGQFMSLVTKNPHFCLSVMRLLTERIREETDT